MTSKNLVAPWVRRFLLEHIVADLNLSRGDETLAGHGWHSTPT